MTSIVEIRDLFVRREKRVVLEIGCLSIEKGQVLAVAGPNGAGKTTLLLVLGRLLKPERGELQFDGQPVKSSPTWTTAAILEWLCKTRSC